MRRKIALAIAVIILCLLATGGFSQKRDSGIKVEKYDTAYVFSANDIETLRGILMASQLNNFGHPMTGNEINALMVWLESRKRLFKKEQPK